MKIIKTTVVAAICSFVAISCDNPLPVDNQLTKQEKKTGWQLLFDGEKMLSYELGSDHFKELVQKSKFKDKEGYAAQAKGLILIQDHGSVVSFKNLKIKEL
jgi:hypothetical protein